MSENYIETNNNDNNNQNMTFNYVVVLEVAKNCACPHTHLIQAVRTLLTPYSIEYAGQLQIINSVHHKSSSSRPRVPCQHGLIVAIVVVVIFYVVLVVNAQIV